jgi:hypothetical protein
MKLRFDRSSGILKDADGSHIVEQCDGATEQDMRNIMTAVNSYDKMRGALSGIVEALDGLSGDSESLINDALRLARSALND